MKNILILLITLVVCSSYAQVGIGTTDPKATLDVVASNQATPTNKDGILIPRVDAFPVTNPGADQDAMFLYLTTTSGVSAPGFYYWNNATTTWLPFGGGNPGWELLGNTGTNPATNFLGTIDDKDLVFKTFNKERLRISNKGQLEFFSPDRLTTSRQESSIFIGKDAGDNIDPTLTGEKNIFIGQEVGLSALAGQDNIGLGWNALKSALYPGRNVAIGSSALENNVNASTSVAIGYSALALSVSSFGNVAIGSGAMQQTGRLMSMFASAIPESNDTTVIGSEAGRFSGGSDNVLVGRRADYNNVLGGQNVVIGSSAGFDTTPVVTSTGRVIIGYNAWNGKGGSNVLAIENSDSETPLLYGEFDNDILRVNGQLQVGSSDDTTNAIVYAFPTTDGAAGQVLTTDGSGVVTWGAGGASSSDADWFEQGGTAAPNAITDNIFTQGNVGIGDITPDASLDISNAGDTLVIVEADSDNSGEDDSPEIRLVQDGGDGSSIMLEGTGGNTVAGTAANSMLLVTRNGQSSAPIHFAANSILGATVQTNGQLQLNQYTTATSFTGTPTSSLGVDATGRIVQQALATNDWSLLGNTGTNPTTNFLGTIDAQDLVFKTENKERLRVSTKGQLEFLNPDRLTTSRKESSMFIGKDAGDNINPLSTAENNIFIGQEAGLSAIAGQDNVGLGRNALRAALSPLRNVAIGSSALENNVFASTSVAIGYSALGSSMSSFGNVAIGSGAMQQTGRPMAMFASAIPESNDTTVIGSEAGRFSGGSDNVIVGQRADYNNVLGGQNVVIGSNAGFDTTPVVTSTGRVIIGYNAWNGQGGSDLLVIENSNSTTPLIGGDFANDKLSINVDLTTITAASSTLTVGGDVTATNYIATVGGFGSGYADYVFQDYFTGNSIINGNYKFMTLDKAMAFVKENGHLPNVKSYEEIKANNFEYDLGATSLKNLEKIEENFLYVSELKIELDTLKEDNKEFKTELDTLKAENKKLKENVAEILRLLKANKTN